MDKKNTLIGITLLVLALVLMQWTSQQRPPPAPRPSPTDETRAPSDAAEAPARRPSVPQAAPQRGPRLPDGPVAVESNGRKEDEILVALSNPLAEARFTNRGGALKEIVLKTIKAEIDSEEPYVLNGLRRAPALSLLDYPGAGTDAVYEVVDTGDPQSAAFRTVVEDRLEITRIYALSAETSGPDPYLVRHTMVFRNLTDNPLSTGDLLLDIGTVRPQGSQDRFLLTFGYSDGEDTEFIKRGDFEKGGFLGLFERPPRSVIEGAGPLSWVSVKNQFFITILTPEAPASGFAARPVEFPHAAGEEARSGMTGAARLPAVTVPGRDSATLDLSFYAGPKEHRRISKLEQGQEKAMQFGFFGAISKLLLLLMNGLHGYVGNYGVAIVMVTLIVRSLFLPINLISSRSMKRVSKLAEPMKLVKEKFVDSPQKQQQAMMELYKLNKVNPIAGCLPLLVQLPIFFALFYMLRSAAELRFAEFLWIRDLSKPDTVAQVGGLPLNVLPFLWLATMVLQMRAMPTPAVDNAQVKLMKFLPFVFFPFTYIFSSGLVLYWTASNLFTIGQQWIINRRQEDFEVILPPSLKKAMEAPAKKRRRKVK